MSASNRTEMVVIERATVTENDHGDEVEAWTTYATRRARVRFGTAQERRQAAQEGGTQSATFECVNSATLRAVTLKDRISYLGSYWDITERAPLDAKTIRFTATRTL